jgi:diaminopimelate decarboxylase
VTPPGASPATSPALRARGHPTDPRAGCQGVVALSARLEEWQLALCRAPDRLAGWLDLHGSPLNILDPAPMARNADQLAAPAAAAGVELKIFFARKANKALSLVDAALRLDLGVDVASERELLQTLARGARPEAIVVTAAVKPRALLELCAAHGPTVVLDNEDELLGLRSIVEGTGRSVPVALRLAPALGAGRPTTRFGLPGSDLLATVDRHWPAGGQTRLPIAGVHFHLDGYDPAERVRALEESLEIIDALRERGHGPRFIDIGGGIPTNYLDDVDEWVRFWAEHRAALRGERTALTYDGHSLGLGVHAGEITGRPNVYPYHQRATRTAWLEQILGAPAARTTGRPTLAAALHARGLELRCEPGRSLLDGCGMTAARVEFRKQRADGTWLIGVAMNRTQCRSTSDDFLVDPLLLRPAQRERPAGSRATGPIEGYLVGAYCIERELLTWRRLRFPDGVEVGDLVVFPNTAGYLMHILESASHQIPLARNLVLDSGAAAYIDPIDQGVATHP